MINNAVHPEQEVYADKRIAYPVITLAHIPYTLWLPTSRYLQAPTRESYTDMTPRRRFPGSIVDLSVRRPPATAADERAW